MHLYLTESNIKVGLSSGKLSVKDVRDGSIVRELPFLDIEGISVFGRPQLSTQLLRGCIEKSIPVLYYSEDGHYFGHLTSSERIDPERQKKQIYTTDNDAFCLEWSKRIVAAKIQSSIGLLTSNADIFEFEMGELKGLYHSLRYLQEAQEVSTVLGYEGNAAKTYFACLPKLIRSEDFSFTKRSSRPPRDPFNSMLSYGYSIVYRNIIGAIEAAGLHPYFAFMHKLRFGHAALASDLIEEWRSWLVERVVLNLVNEESISAADFYQNETGAVYMHKEVMMTLTNKLGDVMVRDESYFSGEGDKKRYGFQVALRKKILQVIDAIEHGDASIYCPFVWRCD